MSTPYFRTLAKCAVITLIFVMCTGCKKKSKGTPPGDGGPPDIYGITPKFLQAVYERPGTNIRIDFTRAISTNEDFTPAEIALLFATLEALTTEEIISKNLKFFRSYVTQSVLYVHYTPENSTVGFLFKEPAGTRPLDPLLGFELVKALGLPARVIAGVEPPARFRTASSRSGEHMFPELDPKVSPLLIRPLEPLPIAPSNLTPATGLPLFVSNPTMVVSPNAPSEYVALTSPAGHNALADERRLVELGDIKQITTADQIRPHLSDTVVLPPE